MEQKDSLDLPIFIPQITASRKVGILDKGWATD